MDRQESYAMEIITVLRKLVRITRASIVVLILLFLIVHGWNLRPNALDIIFAVLAIILSFIVFIFVHEFTHALGFMLLGKVSLKNLEFGFKRDALSPYMHCKVGVPINVYRAAILLPVIVGAIPLIWGIITGNILVYLFGILTFISGYGDIYVLWLLRNAPSSLIVKDHPEKLGCVVVQN
jgi:hypothetical protein